MTVRFSLILPRINRVMFLLFTRQQSQVRKRDRVGQFEFFLAQQETRQLTTLLSIHCTLIVVVMSSSLYTRVYCLIGIVFLYTVYIWEL